MKESQPVIDISETYRILKNKADLIGGQDLIVSDKGSVSRYQLPPLHIAYHTLRHILRDHNALWKTLRYSTRKCVFVTSTNDALGKQVTRRFSPYELAGFITYEYETGDRFAFAPLFSHLLHAKKYFRSLEQAFADIPPFDETALTILAPRFSGIERTEGEKSILSWNPDADNGAIALDKHCDTPADIGVTILHELFHAHYAAHTGQDIDVDDTTHYVDLRRLDCTPHAWVEHQAVQMYNARPDFIAYFLHNMNMPPERKKISWEELKNAPLDLRVLFAEFGLLKDGQAPRESGPSPACTR